MAHIHKFKVGDKVVVTLPARRNEEPDQVAGTIHSMGYAINGTPRFVVCDATKVIPDKHPLGYQVVMGTRIMIVREEDISAS